MGSDTYTCFFYFLSELHCATADRGLAYFSDGFWVDSEFRVGCVMADTKYWIPPGQIQYIEREPKK